MKSIMFCQRFNYLLAVFLITWTRIHSGFINEPCNDRNTLYITSHFSRITKHIQCLDITEIKQELIVQRNFLETYNISNTRKIKTIYADDIGLKFVPKVEKFGSLEEYHLPNNNIKIIPSRAFRRNHKLRLLILNKNLIRTRQNKPLIKSASIKILILSMNNIQRVNKYTFCNLPNMDTLYLDNNKITHLPYDTFKNQPKLKYLRITKNPLKFLSIYIPQNVVIYSDIVNNLEIDKIK